MNRLYPFKSIYNFRDFGDYKTQSGQRVKSDCLFRSAHLARASDQELDIIGALNIGLLVDLRHTPERHRQPNRWSSRPRPQILEYPSAEDIEARGLAPHEMFIRHELQSADDARQYMNETYQARPLDPRFREIFSTTIKHMARTGDNILIHCAAGKDRTGTLTAILLGILGVDMDDIFDDYMQTMKAVDIEALLEPAARELSVKHGRQFDPEILRPMFSVEEAYLQNSFKSIGDLDLYLTESLFISPDEIKAFQDHYLV